MTLTNGEIPVIHLCTLFDSYYIDKGLVLHRSLLNTKADFTLYIFAFDDRCYEILTDMNLERVKVIPLGNFETEELLSVKNDRTKAEYCWTCTPQVIRYVLDNFGADMCTYIDADLYFYKSPALLLDEIKDTGDSIIITEHRFKKDKNHDNKIQNYGKYCVEFNTFRNDANGNLALNWWGDRCLEWCYYIKDGNLLGDQKYLDDWTSRFEGVHELQNPGGGAAPWNLDQYRLKSAEGGQITLTEKESGKEFDLIFYHFQNIRYITGRLLNINSGTNDKRLKYAIYLPYLRSIEHSRKILKEKYGVAFDLSKGKSRNRMVSFIQKYIMQFKCKSFSDIVDLRKIEINQE